VTQPFGPQDPANPYQNSGVPLQPPPRKSSSIWLWLLGGLGCGGVLSLLCSGGVTWFGISFSTKLLADALKAEVADNPVVEEHLGEIVEIKANLMESGSEKRARNSSNNVVVMDAEGSKGNGKFIVESSTSPTPGNLFTKIELRLPDGKTVQIK